MVLKQSFPYGKDDLKNWSSLLELDQKAQDGL